MAKLGTAIVAFFAAVAFAGCGGNDESRTATLGGADWTLTITSPSHGEMVAPRTTVDVAITGRAAVQGETPAFDLGFFVGDQLIEQSRDTSVTLDLPAGGNILRVNGVDENGEILENVLGDEILLNVGTELEPSVTIDIPEDLRSGDNLGSPIGAGIAIPGLDVEAIDLPDLPASDVAPPAPGL
ncbi:hypothetical protein [Vulgatibacter sp.]|uniref:hypothetical protein n=1 Tax=Vulgatibacter sp. TaxID=1971226 RepID=UPI0035626F97